MALQSRGMPLQAPSRWPLASACNRRWRVAGREGCRRATWSCDVLVRARAEVLQAACLCASQQKVGKGPGGLNLDPGKIPKLGHEGVACSVGQSGTDPLPSRCMWNQSCGLGILAWRTGEGLVLGDICAHRGLRVALVGAVNGVAADKSAVGTEHRGRRMAVYARLGLLAQEVIQANRP